jgi:hypothetical protein
MRLPTLEPLGILGMLGMAEPMLRFLSRAVPAVLVLAVACQEPQPAAKQPQKAEVPAPASMPQPTPTPGPIEPTPTPPPLPVIVPEGCKVVIEGQDGNGVKRALVNTSSGGLYDTTVVDGRVIEFECPPAAERQGANLIAEKDNAELVHWAGVNLDPNAGGQALNAADAKPDLPEGLDEETLARLRAKWPDLSQFEEPAVEAGPDTPTPIEEKIPVSFSAHKLYWAELKLEHLESKKVVRVVLDPKASKSLVPGKYELFVKLEDTGAWQDAGELEIVAGKSSYSVQMLDGPPRPQVTSK